MSESKELAGALAKRLASHKISDDAISKLVKDLDQIGHPPIDVDICTFGICLDYYVERKDIAEIFDKIRENFSIGPIRVFPKGIIRPEGFVVQMEQSLDRSF